MINRWIQRMMCLVMVFCVITGASVSAAETASKEIVEENSGAKFSHIKSLDPSFKVTSDGYVIAGSCIELRDGTIANNCKTTSYVQEYQNGQWRNVAYDSGRGKDIAFSDLRYNGVAGREYRLVVYGYAYLDDEKLEKFVMTEYYD